MIVNCTRKIGRIEINAPKQTLVPNRKAKVIRREGVAGRETETVTVPVPISSSREVQMRMDWTQGLKAEREISKRDAMKRAVETLGGTYTK